MPLEHFSHPGVRREAAVPARLSSPPARTSSCCWTSQVSTPRGQFPQSLGFLKVWGSSGCSG